MSFPKRSARGGPRRRIALLVESSANSGRLMLRGIAEYLRQAGPWSLYYEPGHFQTVLPEWMENWQGDGIIARVRNRHVAKQFVRMGVPVVDILGAVADTSIPVVQVDNHAIAELAANHLIGHGFRAFAYCGIRGLPWSQQRRNALREVIRSAGHDYHQYQLPSFHGRAWYSEAERDRLAQWIAGLRKPIGIMACNDWAGQKVLEACRRVGVLVPEEVAVVGVDNDEVICEISDPLLSSIVAEHDRVGFHAAQLLDQLMQGKRAPAEPITVGVPSIVVRRSTAVETISDRDVVAALRYIRENASTGIRAEDVARHLAMSYSTLKRRFHHILSRSIHEEITRVRIERMRELLAETEMTLAQIACATGFPHQEYFGAVFKAHTGMTPKQFRKEAKSGRAISNARHAQTTTRGRDRARFRSETCPLRKKAW